MRLQQIYVDGHYYNKQVVPALTLQRGTARRTKRSLRYWFMLCMNQVL